MNELNRNGDAAALIEATAIGQKGRSGRIALTLAATAVLSPFGNVASLLVWAAVILIWEYSIAPATSNLAIRIAQRGSVRDAELIIRANVFCGTLLYAMVALFVDQVDQTSRAIFLTAWFGGSLIHGSVYFGPIKNLQGPGALLNGAAMITMPFLIYGFNAGSILGSLSLAAFAAAIWAFARDRNAIVRELHEARVAADAGAKAKARFVAMVSHEIRTPLTGIVGIADLLSATSMSPQQQHHLSLLRASNQMLSRIVDDVLTQSKLDASRLVINTAPMALDAAVTSAAMTFAAKAAEKSLRLNVDVTAIEGLFVVGDEARIKQIVANLVSNAVKVTRSGSVCVRVRFQNADVRIDVEDTGPGIPDDAKQRIFEPFEQTDDGERAGGTGLGLSIVRSLVEAMAGSIEVATQVGIGSTFSVYLPLKRTDRIEASTQAAPKVFETAEAGARVALLVVDDHAIIREFIRLALAETHIDVTLAANGQDAIDLAKAQRFDVAIVDYRLPDMDGFDVARRVRSSPSSNVGVAKVVLSTASALDQIPPTNGVFDAHLLKPLTPRAVIETLSDVLSKRSVSH